MPTMDVLCELYCVNWMDLQEVKMLTTKKPKNIYIDLLLKQR